MENRIQINGVWYVREDITPESKIEVESISDKLTFSEQCTYENEKYCWTAMRLSKDNNVNFYSGIDIEFTHKTGDRDKWYTDTWDNPKFFIGILENDPESLDEVKQYLLTPQDIKLFQLFLQELVDIGWLNKD